MVAPLTAVVRRPLPPQLGVYLRVCETEAPLIPCGGRHRLLPPACPLCLLCLAEVVEETALLRGEGLAAWPIAHLLQLALRGVRVEANHLPFQLG